MRFEKISKTQYIKDGIERLGAEYEDIRLPRRATKYSAGYDFFSLEGFKLYPGESIKTPTGIRVKLDKDKFLLIAPRSSLGFKYRLQLDNTVGIIDADYYNSDNEGHIWIKITNDSKDGQILKVKTGDAIAQGIILPFFTTDDDEVENERNGGLGSTNIFNDKIALKAFNNRREEVVEEKNKELPQFDIEA